MFDRMTMMLELQQESIGQRCSSCPSLSSRLVSPYPPILFSAFSSLFNFVLSSLKHAIVVPVDEAVEARTSPAVETRRGRGGLEGLHSSSAHGGLAAKERLERELRMLGILAKGPIWPAIGGSAQAAMVAGGRQMRDSCR